MDGTCVLVDEAICGMQHCRTKEHKLAMAITESMCSSTVTDQVERETFSSLIATMEITSVSASRCTLSISYVHSLYISHSSRVQYSFIAYKKKQLHPKKQSMAFTQYITKYRDDHKI